MTPFDYLNDVLYGKKNIADETFNKDYSAFLLNRGLSYHSDCVMFANEMNTRHYMDAYSQYLYLINTIRSRKRPYHKWSKHESDDKINLIKSYFDYSEIRAREVGELIDEDHIKKIKQLTDMGGTK